jgi:hypothetical protein
MTADIIAMSASQTIAPAITPLSSILDTLSLPEIEIYPFGKCRRNH